MISQLTNWDQCDRQRLSERALPDRSWTKRSVDLAHGDCAMIPRLWMCTLSWASYVVPSDGWNSRLKFWWKVLEKGSENGISSEVSMADNLIITIMDTKKIMNRLITRSLEGFQVCISWCPCFLRAWKD